MMNEVETGFSLPQIPLHLFLHISCPTHLLIILPLGGTNNIALHTTTLKQEASPLFNLTSDSLRDLRKLLKYVFV
jgi:hypothetical protein